MKSYFKFKENLGLEEDALVKIYSGKDASAFNDAVEKGDKKTMVALFIKYGESKKKAEKQATEIIKVG
jgi:hypothetical protein